MMLELKFKKSNQNSNRLNQMANANEGGSCLVSLRLTLSQFPYDISAKKRNIIKYKVKKRNSGGKRQWTKKKS